jgi:hypothetical protein
VLSGPARVMERCVGQCSGMSPDEDENDAGFIAPARLQSAREACSAQSVRAFPGQRPSEGHQLKARVTRQSRALLVLMVSLACALVVLGWTRSGGASSNEVAGRASCPSGALPSGPFDAEAVLAALRRQMPSLYRGLTDMDDPVPINPRTYQIDALIRLGFPPRAEFARSVRKRALQLCKSAIVDRSWAAAVHLDLVQLPASNRIVFMARTNRGWTAWYHS